MENKTFNGIYIAKVENNGLPDTDANKEIYKEDTEKRGRVQVRVLGIHTNSTDVNIKEGIPIIDLPWAEQCGSLIGGGFGSSGAGLISVPENGSHVYVFFLAGDITAPVYFGTVIGSSDYGSDTAKDKIILRTKTGHKITIDDTKDKEQILLEHKDGMAVVLGKSADGTNMVNISAGDEGNLSITGKSIKFTADTINMNDKFPLTSKKTGTAYTIGSQVFNSM